MASRAVDKDVLVSTIHELSKCLGAIISDVKESVKVSLESFVDKDIVKVFALAKTYKHVFQKLKVSNKVELDVVIQQHYRHLEVQEICDEVTEQELELDRLLKEVDKQIGKEGPAVLTEGQSMALDQPVTFARARKQTSLEDLFQCSDSARHEPQTSVEKNSKSFLVLILLRHFA